MKLVTELRVGDEIIINNCLVEVKEVLKNRVLVSKPFGKAKFSVSFFNSKFKDTFNKVEFIQ